MFHHVLIATLVAVSPPPPQAGRAVEIVEISDAGEYRVDSDALAANPDYDGLKEEIVKFVVTRCYDEMMRIKGVREVVRNLVLPKMVAAAEKEMGGMYDLLIDELRGKDRITRAQVYELNYEHCLDASGVRGKG